MLINTRYLINEIIKEGLDQKNTKFNPLKEKDLLNESIIKEKEETLQQYVTQIYNDPNYYKYFQEAVLPPRSQQVSHQAQANQAQQQAQQTQLDAKSKTLQNQLANIQKQQGVSGITPQKQKSLEEKKLEIQAALEKLRIDSDERIANARIASDDKHGTKRTIVGGISSGIGASALPAAIGGAMMIPWGDLGTNIVKAGGWAANKIMGR